MSADESHTFQPLGTIFTHHLGERLHTTTFARPSKYVAHLALSVQRAGGALNVLGARDDVAPVPPEFKINDAFRKGLDFKFKYGGEDGNQKELGYRRILFKRLLFMWRLALQLPPRDLLLYLDGDDVLVQRPLADLVSTWRGLVQDAAAGEEPVIFMGLPTCSGRFSQDHASVVYPLKTDKRGLKGAAACARWRAKQPRGTLPFLDSGGYLGRAGAVRWVLEEALMFARLGLDYICMSTLTVAGIRLGPAWMRVDTEASLFWAVRPREHSNWQNYTPESVRPLCEPGYFDARGLPPAFAPTGEAPSVLHFVGPSKWYWLHRCMDAFLEQRRRELLGFGAWSRGEQAPEEVVVAAGAAAGGFANGTGHYCHFSPLGDCDPCASDWPADCLCTTCEVSLDGFVWYDVDRGSLRQIPFESLFGPAPGARDATGAA